MDDQPGQRFLEGGGEMGALIRAYDWSKTPLGPPTDWSQSLKTVVRLMLANGYPMFILWGPEFTKLYNDSHSPSLGAGRHPGALGKDARVSWPEIWDAIGPQIERVMAGRGATWRENDAAGIPRHGRARTEYWTYSISPIDEPGAPNGVGGAMVICHETTALLAAESRQAFALALEQRLRDISDPREIMGEAAEMLGRRLAADRAGYAEIDANGETFTVGRDWNAPGMRSLAGRGRLDDYGAPLIAELRAGRPVRFADALSEPLTSGPAAAAAYSAANARAAMTLPLIKDGRFAAALYVHHREARTWTEDEEALARDVAERTWAAAARARAEAALRESEERVRLALDSGGFGSWELDVLTGETYRSPRHDQIFGYDSLLPAWRYDDLIRHVAPDQRAQIDAGYRASIDAGTMWRFECRIITGKAEERWIEGRGKPYANANGRVTRLLGTIADITQRKRGEMALVESDARLRELNETLEREVARRTADRDRLWRLSTDILMAARFDGVITAVNPAWTTVLGWTEKELVGAKLFDLIHPDDVIRSRTRSPELPAGETMWRFDNRYRHKNGGYRWISWSAVPGDGLVNAVGRDVTVEKEQRDALERSEAQLRSVFETSYQYQALLTADGRVLNANPVSLAGMGAALADVAGRKLWETPWFAGTPGVPELVEAAIPAVASGEMFRREIVVGLPAGQRAFDFSLRPICGRAGEVVAIVAEALDLTDRRAAEEQLRQAQKMEAVGQLTGGLAHDFNNMLTGIIGSLELLKSRAEQGRLDDAGRYIAAAQAAANSAAALTHRLLAFSRRQTLDPKPTDANALIADMRDLIDRTVGPQIAVATALQDGLWPTLCDPNQLESALLNLCINARDAMPYGGRLTIETANEQLDGQAAREHDLAPGAYVAISVADTGTGMPPEILARAFDPFFTTKPLGMGTGLGLSMIYGFAQQSGGQAQLSSVLGEGTKALIYLPRCFGGVAEPGKQKASSDTGRAADGETVLVVDDEPLVRMLIVDVLEDLGYAAIEAVDGAAGLKVLQSDARIDLLISDVGLPGGMNGRQMADAARQFRPELKVLFITGYAESAVLGAGDLDHGMQVLTKPFAMDAISAKIRRIIADG